jgi:hypothetical protein
MTAPKKNVAKQRKQTPKATPNNEYHGPEFQDNLEQHLLELKQEKRATELLFENEVNRILRQLEAKSTQRHRWFVVKAIISTAIITFLATLTVQGLLK